MANDRGDAANATVRVVHSPDAVQGAAALEEVAPVDPEAAGKPPASFFQLVAGALRMGASFRLRRGALL